MTTEEAIKFAKYAPTFAIEPEVQEFYRMCEEALRAKQERENPKPLTLDELRGMVGEPVYISDMGERFGPLDGWPVIEEVGYNLIVIRGGGWLTLREYGKTWLAYRNKPKEVEKNEML